jgi:uncharacterized protein (DUF488 family)
MPERISNNQTRYGKTNGLKKEVDLTTRVTYSFVVVNQNWKVIEAYNRMLNNIGSDLERNKLL